MKTWLWSSALALCLGVGFGSTSSVVAIELAEIQSRGKLVVAVKENVRPLGFRDATGELQGLEIEVARQLAQSLVGDRAAVEFVPVRNDQRLDVLLAGDVDLVIAQMSATEARSRLVHFSHPYYLETTSFITRSPQILDGSDLVQARIALLQGSSAIAQVRYAFPNAQLIAVDSYQEALAAMEAGQVDVFGGDRAVLTGWTQDYPDYALLETRLGGEAIAVAMPKGYQHSDLFLAVNNALKELKVSGWLAAQYSRWGLAD